MPNTTPTLSSLLTPVQQSTLINQVLQTLAQNNFSISDWNIGGSERTKIFAFTSIIHDLALEMTDSDEYQLTYQLEQGFFDQSYLKSTNLLHHGENVLSWTLDIENLPDWIPDILLKHHERPKGNGFPIGEDIKNYDQEVATFLISHMVFDDIYRQRNVVKSSSESFKNFVISDFKNGTTRNIALRVEELDIFTN